MLSVGRLFMRCVIDVGPKSSFFSSVQILAVGNYEMGHASGVSYIYTSKNDRIVAIALVLLIRLADTYCSQACMVRS